MSTGRSESRRMREAMREANKIARQRLQWQQGQMEEYETMYGGLEQRMLNDAERGVQADYGGVTDRATTDVVQAFDRAREQEARRQAAYGIDPSSGQAERTSRQMGLKQATATAGNVNQAREAERHRADQEFQQNQNRAMSLGKNRFNIASGGIDNAYAGLQSERQSAAQTHGNMAEAQGAAFGDMVGTAAGLGLAVATGGASLPLTAGLGMSAGSNTGTPGGTNTSWGTAVNPTPGSVSRQMNDSPYNW